jgi:4,5-DOPA dioxygenase extradiol
MTQTTRMPAVFLGHGSPMNTLQQNEFTAAWRKFGASIPKPRAVLCVSAHWFTHGTHVTATPTPETIHDFGGFPQALFDFQYPAPGDPALAQRVAELLKPLNVGLDQKWGLDHGTWSVLAHVFPKADIPVVQLSIDRTQPGQFHYDLGKQLAPLRDEGVLIVGSGNVVHNLGIMNWREQNVAFDWATRFNNAVKEHIASANHGPLIDFEGFGNDSALAINTKEHYLPLLYVLGAQSPQEPANILSDGIFGGSISMLSVAVG